MRRLVLFSIFLSISIIIYAQYDTLWAKAYGGTLYENGYPIIQTYDGHYLFSGYTTSFGEGDYDIWLVKTDENGDTLWTKTYGGIDKDACYSLIETSDSSYLLGGYTKSYGAGNQDIWFIKVDSNGDTIWTKTYGGPENDVCYSVVESSDSCYFLGGYTASYGAGNFDYWLIKTDRDGDTLWTETYGDSGAEYCQYLHITHDNYLLLGGYSDHNGGDYFIIKTDLTGNTVWSNFYGGAGGDYFQSLTETSDNIYLIAGNSYTYGPGFADIWLLKTNTNGDTLWTETFGGTDNDECLSIIETTDSCYLMGGDTYSYSSGQSDVWILKTNQSGDTLWTRTYGGFDYDLCHTVLETDNEDYLAFGYTETFANGDRDYWLLKLSNTSGIDIELTDNELDMFIEPINTAFLELNSPYALQGNIFIYDISGRTVFNNSVNLKKGSNTINTKLNPGIYFLKFNSSAGYFENKLINIQ